LPRTLSQKSSYRLLLWGLALVPFAAIADAVVEVYLFRGGNIADLLLSPSNHDLATRVLFSSFILASVYLGMNFLAGTSRKEASLQQRNQDLVLIRQDLEALLDELSQHLRDSSAELAAALDQLDQQGGAMDERARLLLGYARRSSNKLEDRLEMVRELTDVWPGELQRERVRIDKIAGEVAAEACGHECERKIDFKVQPWLSIWCDPRMMRRVLFNLFVNAIETIPADRPGKVEFGIVNRGEQRILFVRCNGHGFNDAQAERIFNPFVELAEDANIKTDAVTLARTRRMINRHGGKLWAEGVENAGSTFYFTYYTR
jgi:light-regulated signal transduction histidine kinase (bacteriophytochrome)